MGEALQRASQHIWKLDIEVQNRGLRRTWPPLPHLEDDQGLRSGSVLRGVEVEERLGGRPPLGANCGWDSHPEPLGDLGPNSHCSAK